MGDLVRIKVVTDDRESVKKIFEETVKIMEEKWKDKAEALKKLDIKVFPVNPVPRVVEEGDGISLAFALKLPRVFEFFGGKRKIVKDVEKTLRSRGVRFRKVVYIRD